MTTEEAGKPAGTPGRRHDRSRPEPGGTARDVGILVTIRSLLPNLAPVEQRVAQAVLDDPAGVAWWSISELARSCGTSATSVVRFCRAIGLSGYPELRLALAGAVAHDDAASVVAASSDIDPDDDPVTITKKIAYADAAAVTETASRLDISALVKVVDALAVAHRIDIYGVGASGLVAVDLQIKLQRIDRPGYAWSDPHMAATSAALRGKGDVAMGLSHTGTTVDTIDALTEARAHGATTVAITNFPWSPITEVADHVLLTAARETAFRSGAMTSRIAQLTVVDCLFVTLAQRNLPHTMDALERTFAAAQAKRVRRARHPKPLSRRANSLFSASAEADRPDLQRQKIEGSLAAVSLGSALDPSDEAGLVNLPLRGDEQQHDRQ
ncbi:MAG: MurR/RpiR family transcriptional regulator [Trebonia sp.]